MRKCTFSLFLALIMVAAPAMAEPKPWAFGWWPGHWEWTEYKKFGGYLENSKETQNQQWANEDWVVQDWVLQHKGEFELIDGFYKTDILRKQDKRGGKPVIVVGPQFYRLGGLDKRRVMTTLDAVYGITDRGSNSVILLEDWRTRRQIGVFSQAGLMIE